MSVLQEGGHEVAAMQSHATGARSSVSLQETCLNCSPEPDSRSKQPKSIVSIPSGARLVMGWKW